MTIRAVVKGIGHYLPDRIVSNADLEALVDTTDDWIKSMPDLDFIQSSVVSTKASRSAFETMRSGK